MKAESVPSMWEKNILKIKKETKQKNHTRNNKQTQVTTLPVPEETEKELIATVFKTLQNTVQIILHVSTIFLGKESRFSLPAGIQRFLLRLISKEIFPTPRASVLMRVWCHSKAFPCP